MVYLIDKCVVPKQTLKEREKVEMDFFTQMIHLQFTLFLLILIGIFLKRKGIISDAGQKTLSDLTVNIILPCNIIESFLGEIDISGEFFKNCVGAFIVSLAIQIFSILVGKFFFWKSDSGKKNIFTYGLIVSNSSFIGLPIINSLYGSLGVLYTSIFQIPVRVTMWSSGLALFTDVDRKEAYKKLVKHPCIIAIVIGIVLMVCPFELPVFVDNTMASISKCMVPISMLAIGSMLANSKVKQLLDPSVLYYCLIRLVVYPLLTLAALRGLQVDRMLADVTVLLTGMPMAGTTAILADKYGRNSEFASQTIFVSTLLSIVTLPLLSLLL